MSTPIKATRIETITIYSPDRDVTHLLREAILLLTGSSSFTGRITIQLSTGGIAEISSSRGLQPAQPTFTNKSLTTLTTCDNPSLVE